MNLRIVRTATTDTVTRIPAARAEGADRRALLSVFPGSGCLPFPLLLSACSCRSCCSGRALRVAAVVVLAGRACQL